MKLVCYSEIPLSPHHEQSLSDYVDIVYEQPKTDEYFVIESKQFFAYQFKSFFENSSGSEKAVGFSPSSDLVFDENFKISNVEKTAEGIEYLGLKRIGKGEERAFPLLKDHLELQNTLFLDRDGVLMTDHGYVSEVDKIEVMEDIIPFLKKAKSLGYQFIVLTNQSGIGRNYYSEDEMHKVHEYLANWLETHDLEVLDWQYCPYHPEGEGKYRLKSFLRKPLPGMLMQAADKFGVDLDSSLMVGDKKSDHLLMPGLRCAHILSNYDLEGAQAKVYHSFLKMEEELSL